MIVGIDARKLSGSRTGIGNYLSNILTELLKIEKDINFILYTDDLNLIHSKWGNYPNVRVEVIHGGQKNFLSPFWLFFLLPRYIKKDSVSVFFAPNFISPLFVKVKKITTIHDLAVYKTPKCYPWIYRLYHKFSLNLTIGKNDHILAVSKSTENDVKEFFSRKIKSTTQFHITYCAVNHENFKVKEELNYEESKVVLQRYDINSEYILFLGELNKRKNLLFLLEVFKETLLSNPNLNLVLCGKEGYGFEDLYRFIKENNMEKNVIIPGYVSSEEIVYLYANAKLFLYPSIYEGFGIPLLESMASGVPVITSNTSSLPEVIDDAGIAIDPFNITEAREKIELLLKDKELYENLRNKGIERAKKFTWRNSAEVLLEIIKKENVQEVKK